MKTIWFDGNITFSEIDNLPNVHALYFVFNNKNEIIYIGMSFALASRFQSHKSEGLLLANKASYIKWKVYTSLQADALSKAERVYIAKFKPALNIKIGGGIKKRYRTWGNNRNYKYELRSEFHEKVYSLLWNYIEHSLSKTHSFHEIAVKTNLNSIWIKNLSVGCVDEILDLDNLKTLYDFLNKTDVPIPDEFLITQPTGQKRTDKLYAEVTKYEQSDVRFEYKYNSCKANFSELCAQLEKELNAKTAELNTYLTGRGVGL